jgi:hypothetical protein
MIDAKLLDILVCPACKTKILLEGDRLVCQNASCGLRYPIRDGIPILLVPEAEKPQPPGLPRRRPGEPGSKPQA